VGRDRQAPKIRSAVSRQQRERLAVEGDDGAEVALIERRERVRRALVGEHHDRRVRQSELEVAIPRAQLPRGLQPAGVECLDGVGDRQVVEQRQLGVDTETRQDQMVGFGGREGGDDQLARPLLQRREDRGVVGIVGVRGAIERARVDDQRADRPSSSRTISSALRAIGAPLPRPTAAERSRRGPAACVVREIASRMISACERPDSADIRRRTAASRSSR